jgi:hypothetical protein
MPVMTWFVTGNQRALLQVSSRARHDMLPKGQSKATNKLQDFSLNYAKPKPNTFIRLYIYIYIYTNVGLGERHQKLKR